MPILFLTESCFLSWLLYSSLRPFLDKIIKINVCFVILEDPFYPFLKFSPENWCLPPGVFNGKAILS